MSLENPTLPLSRGAGGGAGIGEEDPREVAPMPFVLWILFIRNGAKSMVLIFTPREGFKKTKWKFKMEFTSAACPNLDRSSDEFKFYGASHNREGQVQL